MRLLNEAKFKHTVYLVSLQYRLAVVLSQNFAPEDLENTENVQDSEVTVSEAELENTALAEGSDEVCVLPGGYPRTC